MLEVLRRGRGTNKQPVFGIFKRNGHVYREIVPNCKRAALQGIIKGKADPSTVIYSDKWRGYDGLVKGTGIDINGIENFWSFTKRRVAKFNGVKRNLELHLKECEWRYVKEFDILQQELWHIVKSYYKHSNI